MFGWNKEKRPRLGCLAEEAARTARIILNSDHKQLGTARKTLQDFLQQALKKIETLSYAEIDTIFSLMPEEAQRRLSFGSPVSFEGEKYTIVGHFTDREKLESL